MPQHIGNVLSWASELDDETRRQALVTARLPIVHGHVALMPDAHLGKGATVGSVVATKDAVIPSAVGVDIGCGMIAAETDLQAADLPDDLDPLLGRIARRVPAGVGRGHDSVDEGLAWFASAPRRPAGPLSARQERTLAEQFGTLGSGNHFLEICVDERERVWAVLHSGSRGIGNQLAQAHIASAKGLMKRLGVTLEDPELAYVVQGTPEFDAYITDVLFAQDYAAANRARMMDAVLRELFTESGRGRQTQRINCHHNYTVRERHGGEEVWVTRKGAIRAGAGELGIVPGSMGAPTFIVRGLGNPASYESCAHGAGRRRSRRAARREFTAADLEQAMAGKTWLRRSAAKLVDEIPGAYKDIHTVMADQRDLVEVVHELHQVLNYKGL
jgi:tRNA-splicing ligase RtcB (3'-phosphate/5'-hydroxy nucleic acid ligase)